MNQLPHYTLFIDNNPPKDEILLVSFNFFSFFKMSEESLALIFFCASSF